MNTPILPVQVWKYTGDDVYGQPVLVRQADERVSPVKLIFTTAHTSVRTDTTATHGNADETVANVVILVTPNSRIDMNDMLVINGNKVRVAVKHTRYTVAGRLDHHELHCVAWV